MVGGGGLVAVITDMIAVEICGACHNNLKMTIMAHIDIWGRVEVSYTMVKYGWPDLLMGWGAVKYIGPIPGGLHDELGTLGK